MTSTDANTPLTFTANTAGSTVKLTMLGVPHCPVIMISKNNGPWTLYFIDDIVVLDAVGDTVKFWNQEQTLSRCFKDYFQFVMTGSIAASGNVNSMINYGILSRYCYVKLFSYCDALTSPPDFPSTTLATYCYQDTFCGCTHLMTAPALPARKLAYMCYSGMFHGCTNLKNPPELPANRLASNCYFAMFAFCSGLTSAPKLLATKLKKRCYACMFIGCTSLIDATILHAKTSAEACCYRMFAYCNSLKYVAVSFVGSEFFQNATRWLHNVAEHGTFVCPTSLGTGATISRGLSSCPSNWRVVNSD